ncbi:MAG: HD-GYP domain-containing protein [Gaiella sp.]
METVHAFTAAMAVCDPDLLDHSDRVAATADGLARTLGWSERRRELVRLGAALHDVGKVNVRSDVLTKPGRLDAWEMAEMRAHPVEGMWLLSEVRSLGPALPFVLFHHERWDGTGYPTRRSGREIPEEGRLLAIADAFDAMTAPRSYRDSVSAEEAVDEVERCAGSQFDPAFVEAFVDAFDQGVFSVVGSNCLVATR